MIPSVESQATRDRPWPAGRMIGEFLFPLERHSAAAGHP
jgi:hypothetical protein